MSEYVAWLNRVGREEAKAARRPHKVRPGFMASGYNYCKVCGNYIRPWNNEVGFRHSRVPFDSFYARGT